MLNGANTRRVFESFKAGDSQHNGVSGAAGFVRLIESQLGLTTNEFGRPTIRNAKMKPREFSLRVLAESLCGYEWAEALSQTQPGRGLVLEAGGGNSMVTPGNLPNVSAFLGSVSGLLDAAVLEGYEKPEYIIDELVETVPSRTRQTKLIGTGRIGDAAGTRNPGDGHPFAQFNERYITTPETKNQALACGVTFEAVYFDQTTEVLDQANRVGDELALRKEFDGLDVIAGIDNPYKYTKPLMC